MPHLSLDVHTEFNSMRFIADPMALQSFVSVSLRDRLLKDSQILFKTRPDEGHRVVLWGHLPGHDEVGPGRDDLAAVRSHLPVWAILSHYLTVAQEHPGHWQRPGNTGGRSILEQLWWKQWTTTCVSLPMIYVPAKIDTSRNTLC